MTSFLDIGRVFFLTLLAGVGCKLSFGASEQTEISLKVGRDQALSVVSQFKMEKITREDRYFDFYRDGHFELSKETAPFKIRLMITDNKRPKLQTSKLTRNLDFDCNHLNLHSQTKSVYESEDKEPKHGTKEDELMALYHLHTSMLSSIDSLDRTAYAEAKSSLAEEYKRLKFKLKNQLEDLNIEEGFVATYASSKTKYKTDLISPEGQKMELSVTFSRNYCSKSCFADDYTIEFQKSDDSSDWQFSEGTCSILKNLNLVDIKPTPDLNPTLAESLKNHIRLN